MYRLQFYAGHASASVLSNRARCPSVLSAERRQRISCGVANYSSLLWRYAMPLRLIDIQQNILRKNTTLARDLRERFASSGTYVLNFLSSPGAGKTTLLEETLCRLRDRYAVAALVGDQATDNDARRLQRSGAPVKQITTGAECRLDAQMITAALADFEIGDPDVLAIENVGNLICPAEYDLGEDL